MTLVYVEPERADFWQLYREPGSTTYLDPLGPKDCGTHSAARNATRALEGVRHLATAGAQWPPNGYDIRRHCFEADGTRDTSGGVHHGQTKAAVKMLYGVELTNHYAEDFDAFLDALEATHGGSISIRYRRLRDYVPRRGSLTFADNHEMYVNGVDRKRGVLTGVIEPLANGGDAGRPPGLYHGPGEYPITLIKECAGELNVSQTSTYHALGFGKAYYQLTPVTGAAPNAPRLYRVVIDAPAGHSTPIYVIPNGEKLPSGVSRATYTCTRQKIAGLWWYRIVGPSRSGLLGRWFKPNRYTEATYA